MSYCSRSAELEELVHAQCEDVLTPEQAMRIEQLVAADAQLRRDYVLLLQIHALAERWKQDVDTEITSRVIAPSLTETTVPPLAPCLPGAVGSYSFAGWPVAYLVATVIFGAGLLIGSLVHVAPPTEVVRQPVAVPSSPFVFHPAVGRITGMVDCVFKSDECTMMNDELRTAVNGVQHPSFNIPQYPITLGDTIALRSGLLEIAYDTGARVILQGPVRYKVDSATGGHLSIGKLTACVENAANHPLSSSHYSLFAVTTPTAVVTDLGTEFGVEVNGQGDTQSYVFRGKVRVQALASHGKVAPAAEVLHQSDSARISRTTVEQTPRISVARSTVASAFVREIPRPKIKVFDLADVVAGGNGFSAKQGQGINPVTGLPTGSTLAEPKNADINDFGRFRIATDGKYHRVAALPFVDGVFIPGNQPGGVQVDSSGHRFAGFGVQCSTTAGNIWAGGVVSVPSNSMPPSIAALLPSAAYSHTLVPTKVGNVDYASPGHAHIFLPANNGITFDLDAVRHANPGCKLLRFLATAGNTEIASEDRLADVYADIWVLVDGQVRFRRREINKCSGVFPIAFAIAPEDRFLTLVATDGGNDIGFDWILFGDPRIELTSGTSLEQ